MIRMDLPATELRSASRTDEIGERQSCSAGPGRRMCRPWSSRSGGRRHG